ncbi:MAG: hypothetical protein RIQ93_2595 [Verrucomicrobiota bacterium]|jgi:hypothetical protein
MYQARVIELKTSLDAAELRKGGALALAVGSLALCGFLAFRFPLASPAPLLAAIFAGRRYFAARDEATRIDNLRGFYLRGIDRMEHTWHGTGQSGEDYREDGHLYDHDLHILGSGSLFELLCTARTEIGRRRLAEFLLRPASADEARARQAAVQELRGNTPLREAMVALGTHEFSNVETQSLQKRIAMPGETFPAALRPLLQLSSGILTLLLLTGLTALISWPVLFTYIAPLLGLHALIGLALHERVRPILHSGRDLSPEISILGQGLSLLAAQKFTSVKLAALVERASAAPASLRVLERITYWMREREKDLLYGVSLYLMLGTHLAVLMEQWRARHAAVLPEWIDAWAEFEALHAIATYAHEHPADVFPEFTAATTFDAESIGHPLLSPETCVPNSVRFDAGTRFWIISGSNMAGKSTLLRSIGTNAVLALAGAPVRAASLTLAPFQICASISTADSLLEGKSRFMAEVERIRDTLAAASSGPVLFLIDEIFSGTNSHDRRIAAESLIRALLNAGAVGAVSTHDLALTEIALIDGLHGDNIHMCSRSDEDALDFDYRIKSGVNRQSNALAIVRLAGVPV